MKGLIITLQFMTRIPIPINLNISQEEFGASSKFFPLVGLIIGGILALAFMLGNLLFPPLIMGALLITLEIIITGGIHLDGFMDTIDGLMSARPKEQIFTIMKDSRVGAHSVTFLFCLLLIKYSLLVSLPIFAAPNIILLMPFMGRWFMLFCIAFFPYAKDEGLGLIFWQATKKKYWYLGTALLIILSTLLFANIFFIVILITFLISLTPALLINKQLGGQTGDTYGALNEISQVVFLLVTVLIYHF